MGSGSERSKRKVSVWHESFYECITHRAPPGFAVLSEVALSLRPRRADLLLLRREGLRACASSPTTRTRRP